MGRPQHPVILPQDVDGLRLFALGRIPRCTVCPRYRALVAAHREGEGAPRALPAVPDGCTHEVCAPLARRLTDRRPRWIDRPGLPLRQAG